MTQYPTVYLVYKYMKLIDKQLKDIVKVRPPHLASIFKPMQDKYNKYGTKMEDFAEITALLYPQCNLELIELMLLKKTTPKASIESKRI
jgi:hypothetical protein